MSIRSPFLSGDSPRQSPFRRQNSSASPATVRASTPTASPTKGPAKINSLSPEKASPFARRPSQNSQATERPSSPFARPSSSLSISPDSPVRIISHSSTKSTPYEDDTIGGYKSSAIQNSDDDDGKENNVPQRSISEQDLSPFSAAPSSPMIDSPTAFRSQLRPVVQRTVTSSTATTIKQPSFSAPRPETTPAKSLARLAARTNGNYNHVPPALLRSMRESFEVLDSSNNGTINSAAVVAMLDQMGMANSASSLTDFFPPSQPDSLNLARYLDMLSEPLAQLSRPDELEAAFSAFDVDDSGQVDISELRDALLHTAPEPGDQDLRMTERDVDAILGEFTGRRAFGAKGLNAAKGKGEVFRYRDFMASISGGAAQQEAAVAA